MYPGLSQERCQMCYVQLKLAGHFTGKWVEATARPTDRHLCDTVGNH